MKYKLGWLPDFPDHRDLSIDDKDIRMMLSNTDVEEARPNIVGEKVDLSPYFSPIENQDRIGSCTAQAGIALIEYFERMSFGRHTDASSLFLYKTSRDLLHLKGDSGCYLRGTMGAIALLGVCPEEYHRYTDDPILFDAEPSHLAYSIAKEFQATKYFRLDSNNRNRVQLLDRIKGHLRSKIPSMFGFSVFNSINQSGSTGKINMPVRGEKITGGHAVVSAGFDDSIRITDQNGITTVGAIKIRNSWGTEWGENGYGWLPYDYILKGLNSDWWSILKKEWVDTNKFRI